MMQEYIEHNLAVILNRIHRACEKAGRHPDEVKLLLATKTVSPENIKIAFRAGQTLIAENKVQELKDKYEALQDIPHTSHFIGHLQTNKIKEILRCNVACVQSVDRLDLAEKLQQKYAAAGQTLAVLIQVNTSEEASKFGVAPENTLELVRQVSLMPNLKIKGLMTIGLFSNDEIKVRACFQLLRQLKEQIMAENIANVEMTELSMGMSGDLEMAIEEGATIVRVGTAVFGQRIYPGAC